MKKKEAKMLKRLEVLDAPKEEKKEDTQASARDLIAKPAVKSNKRMSAKEKAAEEARLKAEEEARLKAEEEERKRKEEEEERKRKEEEEKKKKKKKQNKLKKFQTLIKFNRHQNFIVITTHN